MNDYICWLKRNNYSKNTIRTYRSVLKNYEDFFHDVRLLKKEILRHRKSPNTCILHYNVITTYMNWKSDKRVKDLKTLKLPHIPVIYRNVFTKKYLYNKTELKKKIQQNL